MSIWVCGEVLIDLIPDDSGERVPHVGGGPANTAKALARLGHDVYFIDGISSDKYGQMSRQELLDDEVKLDLALSSDKPTCLAIVSINEMRIAFGKLKPGWHISCKASGPAPTGFILAIIVANRR